MTARFLILDLDPLVLPPDGGDIAGSGSTSASIQREDSSGRGVGAARRPRDNVADFCDSVDFLASSTRVGNDGRPLRTDAAG